MDFIVSLLLFDKDDFGIRYPTKVDMSLNKPMDLIVSLLLLLYFDLLTRPKMTFRGDAPELGDTF